MKGLFQSNTDKVANSFQYAGNSNSAKGVWRLPSAKLKEAAKTDYSVEMRFLKNLIRKGDQANTIGPDHINVDKHYVRDLPGGHKELEGTYTCAKNVGDNCKLCSLYYKLKDSPNQLDQQAAFKSLKKGSRYFSYVLIINDELEPENNGRIMVFEYGKQISDIIEQEAKGKFGNKCDIFSATEGKNFRLNWVKNSQGGDYKSSRFDQNPSVIKAYSPKSKEWHEWPTTTVDNTLMITEEKIPAFVEYLKNRDADIEDFAADVWDELTTQKVDSIVQLLTTGQVVDANIQAGIGNAAAAQGTNFNSAIDSAKVFGDDALNETFNNIETNNTVVTNTPPPTEEPVATGDKFGDDDDLPF